MRKFAVIGLGTFGISIAQALTEKGAEVIAIDRDMDRVEAIQDYVSVAVRLDSTDENALKAQGLNELDVAVVCIGEDFESNLLTSVLLKQLGVKTVVTRATKPLEEKILKSVGIDRVALPEQEIGEKLAYSLMHPTFKELFYLAEQYTIAELDAPNFFAGKKLRDIDLRGKYGLNIIIIRRQTEVESNEEETTTKEKVILPEPKTEIQEKDTLVMVGKSEDLNTLMSQSD